MTAAWLAALLALAPDDALEWDARKVYEKAVGRRVALATDGAAIELESGELFEDDGPAAGFSYKPNEEVFSGNLRIRKELVLPDPRARAATLLVGPGGALEAAVNGVPVALGAPRKTGGYWQAYEIDPAALRPGANEIVLTGSGKVWIARADDFPEGTRPPGRSSRSDDGGKTWKRVEGEYGVRLFLDRHRERGTVLLPVIDAGNLAERPIAPPLTSIGRVRIDVVGEGAISVRARSGPVPVPHGACWSDWRDGGVIENPAGRYIQIEITLSTPDPLSTPRLRAVRVTAAPERPADWTAGLRIVDLRNDEIVRSAIPFEVERFDHPRLKELRDRHRLDDLTRGAKSELEVMSRLAAWTAGRWTEGHLRESYPPWDATEILKPRADGKPVGGFCLQYNLVFLQACESFGLVGRVVSLGPGDGGRIRGGHEAVEIWSNEHRKWIYIDGNAAWYVVDEASGAPLSLLELRERQLEGEAARPVKAVVLAPSRYVWKGLANWPPFAELRLVPRSDFLAKPSPLPLNQGMRGWFWTGHYAWTDARAPASLLYGNRVTRRGDWEWSVNGVRMFLEAEAPGEVRVQLDREVPGLDAVAVRFDGAEKRTVGLRFAWRLHPGENRLEVRAVNTAGREGPSSWIVVERP